MLIVAIDPGKLGSIVMWDDELPGKLLTSPLPLDEQGEWDAWAMAGLVEHWLGIDERIFVIIEECHAFPGAQAYGSAEVMRGFGMWQGCLARLEKHQVNVVPASVWKKAMGVTVPVIKAGKRATEAEKKVAYQARKVLAVTTAERLFPDVTFKGPKGGLWDGKAEAALMVLYLRGLLCPKMTS